MSRRTFSSYGPLCYKISVTLRCAQRHAIRAFGKKKYASHRSPEPLKYRVYKHQSVLIRRLGDTDMQLQYNKVTNLKLAIEKINGIIIRPGETFSFWKLVGKTSRKLGYLEGVMLLNGEAVAGIGGGMCQIANLIHWLILHSPLTVTERHHHGFDAFPDDGRVLPFGSGATISYNYIDYQFTNYTERTYQMLFWFDDKCINGDLRIDEDLPYSYHILEKNHRFVRVGKEIYRRNEIWRTKNMKLGNGEILEEVLLQKNNSLVKYKPSDEEKIEEE